MLVPDEAPLDAPYCGPDEQLMDSPHARRALEAAGTAGPALRLLGSPAALAAVGGTRVERTRVILLSRLRWVAIAGQLLVAAPAIATGWLEPRWLGSYLGAVCVLVGFNLAVHWRLTRRPRRPLGDVLVHIGIDLLALTTMLVLSGGAWNPLAPIFVIHAGLGALMLHGWRSLALAGLLLAVAVAISLLPPLTVGLPPAVPTPNITVGVLLLSHSLVALVIWAMTVWLSEGLAAQQHLLQNLRDHQGRIDRLRAVGALAAGFSHEFSTPLNTLRLRLERIERKALGEAVDKEVAAAMAAAGRCEAVLRSMVGRQLDPKEMRLEPVDMGALVRRIAQSWTAEHRGVEVELVDLPERRCHLPTVPFTQVLLDLLDNAEEAMQEEPPQHGTADLRVRVSSTDHHCVVSVLDRGPGYPDVVRTNLGQPFLTTKPGGTGLGLYNAHSLALALDGELELADRQGGGAEVRLSLPWSAAPSEEEP